MQLGRFTGQGKGNWGFPSSAAWPHWGLSLPRGAVVWRTAGLASIQANEFIGSEAGAGVSCDTPSQSLKAV